MQEEKFMVVDGDTLMTMPLPPIRFVVESLLPSGLHLMAGSPKTGKSWLVLWLCLNISRGEPVWNYRTRQGSVLYLALEDSLNRLQSRLFDITDTAPACLYFATMANSIGEGLELQMKDFISTHRDTRLIVVDTLQRIREEANDQNAYANDYRDLSFLKNIADQNSIAILLVHHTRKQRDRDPFNMISGTTALSGAADSSFILERVERGIKEATLTCVGRDIEDRVLRLKFDSGTHIWKILWDSVSEPLYKLPQAVSQVIERVKADGAFYGTATELLKQLCLSENLSPSVLSKQILRNLAVLEDEGICYESRRSGSRRAFSLTYHANDVNDGNDANLLSGSLPNFPSQASLPSRSLIAEPNQ